VVVSRFLIKGDLRAGKQAYGDIRLSNCRKARVVELLNFAATTCLRPVPVVMQPNADCSRTLKVLLIARWLSFCAHHYAGRVAMLWRAILIFAFKQAGLVERRSP